MQDKDLEINELANRVSMLLLYLDSFTDEDISLLKKTHDVTLEKISYNNSVSIVAVACGCELYNSAADIAIAEQTTLLIELLEARKDVREKCIDAAERKIKNSAILSAIYK